MPIYEYYCEKCEDKFDELYSLKEDSSQSECPECHTKCNKQYSSSLSFRGLPTNKFHS